MQEESLVKYRSLCGAVGHDQRRHVTNSAAEKLAQELRTILNNAAEEKAARAAAREHLSKLETADFSYLTDEGCPLRNKHYCRMLCMQTIMQVRAARKDASGLKAKDVSNTTASLELAAVESTTIAAYARSLVSSCQQQQNIPMAMAV